MKNKTKTDVVLATICTVVLLALLLGMYFYIKEPLHRALEEKEHNIESQRELAELEKEEAALQNKVFFLKTKRGMRYHARCSGYYDPDDILIVLEHDSSNKSAKNKENIK